MNNLIKMCRTTRINSYFKKIAHAQIEVGFRILEYLEPDSVFVPKDLDSSIMDKFLQQDVTGAVHSIILELSIDNDLEHLVEIEKEAVEFAQEVLVDYLEKKKKAASTEREQLLIRLGELDKELN